MGSDLTALDGNWGTVEVPKNPKDSIKAIFGEESLKTLFHEKNNNKGKKWLIG